MTVHFMRRDWNQLEMLAFLLVFYFQLCMDWLNKLSSERKLCSSHSLSVLSTLVCGRNEHLWNDHYGLVWHLYCYHIPPSPRYKKNLTFNIITLTHSVSDTLQTDSHPVPAVCWHCGRVKGCTKTYSGHWMQDVVRWGCLTGAYIKHSF